jgi:2-aminoadipate transaminase
VPENEAFSYDELFADDLPDTPPRGGAVRGKYDFAVAYPPPETLPLDGLVDALKEGLRDEGRDLAVYPHPQGYPPLREYVASKLARDRDIHVSPDDIVLADGSSQPIHMLAETLLNPGDVVLTEHFVYSGTLATLRRFGADVRGVACDDDGMLPDALQQAIDGAVAEGKTPKMIYTIPTFQNPLGFTMTLERRKAMLEVAYSTGVPILEDDCYVDLRYDGEDVTSIHSLDDRGMVMYVASFSKIIAPAMRMGYLTAPSQLLDKARVVKSGAGVNQFTALTIHRYAMGGLDEHIAEANDLLRVKRDAMLAALGENFGSAAKWNRPEGALFVWLEMPEGVDLVAALPKAMEADVGYLPGPSFAPDGESGKNCARLCFGYNTPEEIHEGIARLAKVFEGLGMMGG